MTINLIKYSNTKLLGCILASRLIQAAEALVVNDRFDAAGFSANILPNGQARLTAMRNRWLPEVSTIGIASCPPVRRSRTSKSRAFLFRPVSRKASVHLPAERL